MTKKKILIIDDDKEICFELKEILVDEGYDVFYETDGLSGFNNILQNDYDLIIQDLKLPGINGVDLLKKIKNFKNAQKVIILTGRPLKSPALNENEDFKNEENTLFTLADYTLNKPFDISNILKIINFLIKM